MAHAERGESVRRSERSGGAGTARRVAILAPMGSVDHQPGIMHAAEAFADAGYSVDLFLVRNLCYAEPRFKSPRIRVHLMPWTFDVAREPRWIATVAFALWLPWITQSNYVAVFAGGIRGLFAAWFLSLFRRCRIINLQLELYIGKKLNTRAARLFKWWERRAISLSWLSLIHDEHRAQMLSADARISRSCIELLPNAPRGQGRIVSSRMLHKRFRLPEETRLLLAPGTVNPAFESEETVRAAQDLPEGWCCVIHSAQRRGREEAYIRRLEAANVHQRALLSLEPVPFAQVEELMASATIGLALYGRAGGPNTTEVGLASGKLCHFLQLGVPVIVSDFPSLREFVLTHRVGLPLRDFAELPKLIAEIESDLAGYRSRAAACFTRELSYDTHFRRVLDRLEREIR